MARAYVLVCALVAAAFLFTAMNRAEGAVSCSTVASCLSRCINYIHGSGPLTAACCGSVKRLAAAASTTHDRQIRCNCLKSLVARMSGIKYNLMSGVPGKCGVSVPYAINPSTNCSKVR